MDNQHMTPDMDFEHSFLNALICEISQISFSFSKTAEHNIAIVVFSSPACLRSSGT